MCLHQNSIVIKFFKILKIHEIFCENLRIIFFFFYDVHKQNMFTINLEYGREAPSKVSSEYFLDKWSTRLQNMYNHMVGRAASFVSPFYSTLLDCIKSRSNWFQQFVLDRQMITCIKAAKCSSPKKILFLYKRSEIHK